MNRRSFLVSGVAIAGAAAVPGAAATWTASPFNISWGGEMREVTGRVRGCWGIFKNFRPEVEGEGYTLTHLPSGYRAGWSEDEAVMQRFSAALDRMTAFEHETPESVLEKQLKDPVQLAAKKAGIISLGDHQWAAA